MLGCGDEGGNSLVRLACMIPRGEGLGVELYTGSTYRGCCFDLTEIRPDEDRRSDAPSLELRYNLCEEGAIRDYIPSCIARQYTRCIWDEGGLRGTYLIDELHECGGGVPLYIELCSDDFLEVINIPVANMPFIGTRMYCDALCAKAFAVSSDLQQIGYVPPAGITQCSYLIDIDA